MTAPAPTRRNWCSAVGPAIVAIVAVSMCAWSWGKWPDPVIDFGREIYVPWQLSQGQVLYRDIVSYFNGPLSPYTHALLFRIFGAGLLTLVMFNVLVVAALAGMLYWLIVQVADRLTATAGGVVFFVFFAFAQFVPTGNYNYVTPYSYELSHGITLTVASIMFLALWMRRDHVLWLALSGAMLGLVALTKAEVFLAAAVALVGGFSAAAVVQRRRLRATPIFIAGALVPLLIAWELLSLAMSPGDVMRGLLGAWNFIAQRELTSLPYFRELAGTANIPGSMQRIILWSFFYAATFSPAVVLGFVLPSHRTARVVSGAVFAGLLGLGWWRWTSVDWYGFVSPAQFVLLVAALIVFVQLVRTRSSALVLPLTMLLFAGAMLAKIPLNVHIFHYGFALAMPATLMLVVIFLGWLPRLLERHSASGWPLRATVAAALIVAMWAYSHPMSLFFSIKRTEVSSGADRFRADKRGVAVNQVVEMLLRSGEPRETLVMIPEGLLINYLARRTNPTGQLNFTPPAIIMYGEDAMIEALKRNPPDLIGMVTHDTVEYGPRFFGRDYARELARWIESNYDPTPHVFRSSWLNEPFEIRLLRRRHE